MEVSWKDCLYRYLWTFLLQFPAAKDIIFEVKDIRFIPAVCPDPKDKLVVGRQIEVVADEDKVNDGGHVGDTRVREPAGIAKSFLGREYIVVQVRGVWEFCWKFGR